MTATATATKGLTLSLFKNPLYAGCSNQGISEKADQVTLVEVRYADGRVTPMPKASQVFPVRDDAPAVALVQRNIMGRTVWHVQPVSEPGKSDWYMAGGAMAGTSDSRFSELLGGFYGALALHDRVE